MQAISPVLHQDRKATLSQSYSSAFHHSIGFLTMQLNAGSHDYSSPMSVCVTHDTKHSNRPWHSSHSFTIISSIIFWIPTLNKEDAYIQQLLSGGDVSFPVSICCRRQQATLADFRVFLSNELDLTSQFPMLDRKNKAARYTMHEQSLLGIMMDIIPRYLG